MKCRHRGCTRNAARGKVFCSKHLHGQRQSNPVSGTGTSYGTLTYDNKKNNRKKKKGKNK